MIDKSISKAIIDFAIFLEYSNNIADEDSSIEAMENLAFQLQSASKETREALVSDFQELSSEYGEKSDFVKGLGDSLGLVE